VNGASGTTLRGDLEAIIRCQGAEYRLKTSDDAIQWLSTRPASWLMIIDNVDDPSIDLFPLIPKARHCHVIITSRDSTRLGLANPCNRHTVGDLEEKASIDLLLRLSSYPLNDANTALASQITEELGYLPLALAHAGGYISIHGGLSSYLEMYRKSRREMLEHLPPGLPSDYNLAVAATIEMSFTRLSHQTRDILHLLSHFQTGPIAEKIIVRAAEREFAHVAWRSAITPPAEIKQCADALVMMFCPHSSWSRHDFNQLVQPCLQYSLLRSGESEKMGRHFSMHPLVQSWLRLQTSGDTGPSKQDLLIRLLASSITIGRPYEYLEFNQVLRPHIQLVDEKRVKCIGDKHAFRYVLYENGDYSRALDYLKSCVEDERKTLGEEHHETLSSMHNLSTCYSRVGKYVEALEVGEKVMGLHQKSLGDEHPYTLRSMDNLSIRYSQVGRYAEALEMGEKVTSLYQKKLGNEHPDTLCSMHNLSILYSQLGRYAEALEIDEKVTGRRQKTLGNEHPDTLRSMHNLSLRYSEVGRYAEALEMGERVTGLYQTTLGNEHPDTLRSILNLSNRYSEVGRYTDAIEMNVKVVQLYQKTMGNEHPNTLRSMHDLSIHYSEVGRHAEALDMGLKIMEMFERILGKEHPDTLGTMATVSSQYSKLGKYDEAIRFALNTLDSCQRVLGAEHPQTKRSSKLLQDLRSIVCPPSLGRVPIS
jgi:tetratricopeptide (TPR) repeat protein